MLGFSDDFFIAIFFGGDLQAVAFHEVTVAKWAFLLFAAQNVQLPGQDVADLAVAENFGLVALLAPLRNALVDLPLQFQFDHGLRSVDVGLPIEVFIEL